MSVNDGGPAFPGTHLDRDVLELLRNTPANFSLQEAARIASHHGGMTLRDYFAAKAMQGLIAQKFGDDAPVDEVCAVVAYTSFQFADAMLSERSKGGSL